MLPVSRAVAPRLRPRGPASLCQARLARDNPRRSLTNAEAAPAAPEARHDHKQRPSAVGDVLARRARAGKLVAGIAAASDSDMFKGPVSHSRSSAFSLLTPAEPRKRIAANRQAQGKALGW